MLNEGLGILGKEMKGVLVALVIFIILVVGYYLLAKYDLL